VNRSKTPLQLNLDGAPPVDVGDQWSGVYYFHGWTDREFWPWLAAFIDGEGHIARPAKTGLVLSIANTDRDVIESIRHRVKLGDVEMVTTAQCRRGRVAHPLPGRAQGPGG